LAISVSGADAGRAGGIPRRGRASRSGEAQEQKIEREKIGARMIIEDLQHRYDQLRERTARVRSYL